MDDALQPPAASSDAGGESPATATDGLRRSYLIGLALLAALAILGQVLVQRSLNQQVGDTGVVNLAGIQRARSERLAKELLATIIIDEPDSVNPSELRLETTLTAFKQTWVGLIQGDGALGLSPRSICHKPCADSPVAIHLSCGNAPCARRTGGWLIPASAPTPPTLGQTLRSAQ